MRQALSRRRSKDTPVSVNPDSTEPRADAPVTAYFVFIGFIMIIYSPTPAFMNVDVMSIVALVHTTSPWVGDTLACLLRQVIGHEERLDKRA